MSEAEAPRSGPAQIAGIIAPVLAYLVVPVWMMGRAIGPYRAPGREGDGLFGELYAAAMVRRWWLGDAAPLTSDTGGGASAWWPASPMGALIQALLPVDGPFALGLVLVLGMWLSGYGPYRLVRAVRPGLPWFAAVFAGWSVQLSPVVLRAVPDADVAALGVGALALGLAAPRWAWLGGLWSWPGAVVFGIVGLYRRNGAWLLAGLPALAVLSPPSDAPGALRVARQPLAESVAYIGEEGAVFPMPPAEAEAYAPAVAPGGPGRWTALDAGPGVGLLPGTLPPGMSPGSPGMIPGSAPLPGPGQPGQAQPGQAQPGQAQPGPVAPGEAPLPPGLPGGAPAEGPGATPVDVPPSDVPPSDVPPSGAPPPGAPGAGPPARGADPDAPVLSRPPPSRPWFGAILVPMQRIHGGPLAVLGVLVALLGAGTRRWGAAGLAGLVVVTAVYGWQPFPGEAEVDPASAASLQLLLDADAVRALPGRDHGAGSLVWGGLLTVCGAVGLAQLFAGRGRWLIPLVLLGPALENPRLVAPITALPLSPGLAVLSGLAPGAVLVLPSPDAPYFQGRISRSRVWWQTAEANQTLAPASGAPEAVAAVVGELSAVLDLPIDTAAAEAVWEHRSSRAFSEALKAGFAYVTLDLGAVPPALRPQFDGWMAARVGQPLSRDGDLLVYDLRGGPAAEEARELPGFNQDEAGTGSVPAAGDIGGFEPAAETGPTR